MELEIVKYSSQIGWIEELLMVLDRRWEVGRETSRGASQQKYQLKKKPTPTKNPRGKTTREVTINKYDGWKPKKEKEKEKRTNRQCADKGRVPLLK